VTRLPSLGPRGEGWVVLQLVLLWLAVAVAFGWNGAWTREPRYLTTLLAVLVGLAGAALTVRGVLDLRGAMTPLPRPRDDGALVETGAYRLVRHPVYGGIVLLATAWGLLTASPAALAVAAVLLVFFRLKSAREEAWLVERYPGYEAYRRRTRRMIPFVY
jgi:protein-S-isoprenylcysteine O-methyltransferase Ste14